MFRSLGRRAIEVGGLGPADGWVRLGAKAGQLEAEGGCVAGWDRWRS